MPSESHPFITFEFDTQRQIGAQTWLRLGEALSKCQHLGRAPMKPAFAKELSTIYLARGVQGTTAIEGNTLTTQEVLNVVKSGKAGVAASREYLEREVQNILAAVSELDAALRSGTQLPITRDRLCHINGQVLDGIPDEDWVVPGKLREVDVGAGTYGAPPWREVPDLVDQFTKWLDTLRPAPGASPEQRFVSSVLSAILAHLYIAWIHPFGNGNGRTARLIEVQILSESGVVPMVATNLLSNFYNQTRNAYYLALNAAQHDAGAFVAYAVEGFLDELRAQVDDVHGHNFNVQWDSYIYQQFDKPPHTEARGRQRLLALSMPAENALTPEEATLLNAELAKAYARCGERTPTRDLNVLHSMGLVVKVGKRKFRAAHEVMQSFIPPTSQPPAA